MKESQASIDVEVAYADANRQIVLSLCLPEPVTVADALSAATQDPQFSDIDCASFSCGVFGRRVEPEALNQHCLAAGDRVELYRELVVDAKTARRLRASQQQTSR